VRIEEERNRLAALMSELAQSVVVCNVEGRVLLYNARADRLLRKPLASGQAQVAPVSVWALGVRVFDRNLIIHGLERAQEPRAAAERPRWQASSPRRRGQLVRVQLAPVFAPRAAPGRAAPSPARLIWRTSPGIGRVAPRQAVATLTRGPGVARQHPAVETIVVSGYGGGAELLPRHHPRQGRRLRRLDPRRRVRRFVEPMAAGGDAASTCRGRAAGSRRPRCDHAEEFDESIWLKVDSYSLVQAFAYVARRLQEEFQIREIRFALAAAGALAHLDLIWTGAPLGVETQMAWQTEPMTAAGEAYPTALAEIIARHDAEIWYQIDKPTFREFFRIAIPVTRPGEAALQTPLAAESRPEYYDFDLFHQPGQTPELDNRPLSELNYTVFDTETTGLSPSDGDEIVSMGAVRIVNGRLLEHEVFEQLVDPGRRMSAKAAEITGIDDAMLAGQPAIDTVLPAFHQFAEDTVLVAHNAAFDMRFLQLKEEATGICFRQPVLDTLLLSAVIHPNQESHKLEAICERLGINVIGRHTALGDAIVTGEVFLKMIPLLAEMGINTLREAREAAELTYYARIKY
jgi:DNA polymerase-3 subunit epsilon